MSKRSQDEADIRQLVARADASQADVERFTSLLTEDVVIVNIAGIRVVGRDNFRSIMATAMKSRLSNVRTSTEVEEITFLRPDVALIACTKDVFDENADAPDAPPSRGTLTFVAVKGEGGWRITLAQTTPTMT
jgi:uncharacterized protein (TIGR02246 family)